MDHKTGQTQGRRGLYLVMRHTGRPCPPIVLALDAGIVLTLLLLSVMTAARGPEFSPTVSQTSAADLQVAITDESGTVFWLVLDSARPVDEVLPLLEEILERLGSEGRIGDFDLTPRQSNPAAVFAIQVVAAQEAYDLLRRLPGVLDAVAALPPPPGTGFGAMAVTGVITGVVTAADSEKPLDLDPWGWPMSAVRVYDAVSFAHLGDFDTDASGQYSVTVTAPYSQAKVYVSPPAGYLPLWYDGKPYFSEADTVALQSGGTVTGIDLALAGPGSISVTLSLDSGGAPPIGTSVGAYEADGMTPWGMGPGCTTDGTGHCVFDLAPGTYWLCFGDGGVFPGVVFEYYEDADGSEDATLVTVASGVTTSVSAQVGLNGILKGTVTEEGSGSELVGVGVSAYDAQSSEYWCDQTDGGMFPTGEYECALAPGSYRVKFCKNSIWYQHEYHDNALTPEMAEWVTITAGMTTTIDAALMPYTRTGFITGTITKDGGQPLEGGDEIEVQLSNAVMGGIAEVFYGDDWTTVYSATVPVGTFEVFFNVSSGDMQDETYCDTPPCTEATWITVTEGMVTPDISTDLTSYGSGPGPSEYGCIRGQLTSNGMPVEGDVQVMAHGPGRGTDDLIEPSDNGMYLICDLVVGDYMVSFSRFPSATTWYSDSLSPGDGTTVTVESGLTTLHVDGTLDDLGACISGKVVDAQGQGVSWADLVLRDVAGYDYTWPVWWGRWGTELNVEGYTDDDGGFVACGLPPGTYTIEASEGDWSGAVQATVGVGETKDVGDVVIGRHVYLPLVLRLYQ